MNSRKPSELLDQQKSPHSANGSQPDSSKAMPKSDSQSNIINFKEMTKTESKQKLGGLIEDLWKNNPPPPLFSPA